VARGYANAIRNRIDAQGNSRQGSCYPSETYGWCDLFVHSARYGCYHFDAVPNRTRGLVRCQGEGPRWHKRRISFNIGF
jgi:hypothetical protein